MIARLAVAAPVDPELTAVVEPVHAVYDPTAHRWAMAMDATTPQMVSTSVISRRVRPCRISGQ